MHYPKISVVTACRNMEKTIESTILSVLSQNYPNLEYIIVDGASTDGTLDIVNRYKDKISIIISEPDNGMYDAINKGFSHATGDIFAWLNADDIYMPWAFQTVARLFAEHKEVQWAIGQTTFMYDERIPNKFFNFCNSYSRKDIRRGWHRWHVLGNLQQESMFWRRELWNSVGGLDLTWKVAADFELWIRFAEHAELVTIASPLAAFYMASNTLSHTEGVGTSLYLNEVEDICNRIKSGYPSFILKYWGDNNVINRLFRLLRWRKTPLFFYSFIKKKWVLKYVRRSCSNITLSNLYLESRTK